MIGELEYEVYDADGIPLAGNTFDVFIPEPGPPEAPLFGFASPGTQVGYIRVSAAQVPEPATLLLLGSGIAGLIALRKRFTA